MRCTRVLVSGRLEISVRGPLALSFHAGISQACIWDGKNLWCRRASKRGSAIRSVWHAVSHSTYDDATERIAHVRTMI